MKLSVIRWMFALKDLVEIVPDRPGKDHAYLMDSKKGSDKSWLERVAHN